MTPVSSVAAFLARAALSDGEARELLAAMDLDADARAVAESQSISPARRLEWLQQRTARQWTVSEVAHAEAQTFVAIRRELQARGLFSSDPRASASPR